MKTKIKFLKNWSSLCCFLILVFFNSSIKAQIVYTDIPDATPNATFSLDLNNDTIVDFVIHYGVIDGAGMGVICTPQNNNAYSGNLSGGVHLPWAFSASKNICDTLTTWFDTGNPGILAFGTTGGYWVGETNKYLALKLIVRTDTIYGWVRIDVLSNSSSFTVKDYAYESAPNTCIQAGQTTLEVIESSKKDGFSIFPNPFVSSTTIQTTGNLQNSTLTIYNTCGKTLKQVKNISGHNILIFRENLESGLYFIQLTEENKIIAVKKLSVVD
jgi:hypothetical protein